MVRICIVFPTCNMYIALQTEGRTGSDRVWLGLRHACNCIPPLIVLAHTRRFPRGDYRPEQVAGHFWELGEACSTHWETREKKIVKDYDGEDWRIILTI
jgi:hypothetical protein